MKNKKHYVFVILTVLTTIFIWSNSFLSKETSGDLSKGILGAFLNTFDPAGNLDADFVHHIIRKCAHCLEYFTLGMFYTFSFHYSKVKKKDLLIYSLLGCILTAVADEYIQSFTGRGSLVSDVVLDFCASSFAIFIISGIIYMIQQKDKRT